MKISKLRVLCCLALSPLLAEPLCGQSEYLLFFDAYEGQTITAGNPLTIPVAGYGSVMFSSGTNFVTGLDSEIGIGPVNGNYYRLLGEDHPLLVMDHGDVIVINFIGEDNVIRSEQGYTQPASSSFTTLADPPQINSQDFNLLFLYPQADRNGGMGYFYFETPLVPEPTGFMLLGVTGSLGLLRRNRRRTGVEVS